MLRILFGFEGRIGRRNYLLAILGQSAVLTGMFLAFGTAILSLFAMMGIEMAPGAATPTPEELSPEQTLMASGVGIATIVFMIIVLGMSIYMGLAAQVKRLHDMNMSGWFTAVNFIAWPLSFSLIASDPSNGPIALLFSLVPFGLGIACLFFPGTRGPNQFGDDRLSLFDMPEREGETWADRAQAHRKALRDEMETAQGTAPKSSGSGGGESTRSPKPRRTRERTVPAGKGGFGKRGLA